MTFPICSQEGSGTASGVASRLSILLAPFGSAGDINPQLWLAEELAARGHAITFLLNPVFEKIATSRGFGLIPAGTVEGSERLARNPNVWHVRKGPKVVFGAMKVSFPRYLATLDEAGKDFDLVITSAFGMAAAAFAEKRGIPHLRVHVQPNYVAYFPGGALLMRCMRMLKAQPLRNRKRFVSLLESRVFAQALADVNALREKAGLPPWQSFYRQALNTNDRVALLFPEWLSSGEEFLPHGARRFGFPEESRATPAPLPPEIRAFLEQGPPPVVWTHGSMNFSTDRFACCALEVMRHAGLRGILVVPEAPSGLRLPQKGFLHARHVPFRELFPLCQALVHHGGDGTLALAARAGLPQLIVPLTFNHQDNARWLKEKGVADDLSFARLEPQAVAEKLGSLLTSSRVQRRCSELRKLASTPMDWRGLCNLVEGAAGSTECVLVDSSLSRQALSRNTSASQEIGTPGG